MSGKGMVVSPGNSLTLPSTCSLGGSAGRGCFRFSCDADLRAALGFFTCRIRASCVSALHTDPSAHLLSAPEHGISRQQRQSARPGSHPVESTLAEDTVPRTEKRLGPIGRLLGATARSGPMGPHSAVAPSPEHGRRIPAPRTRHGKPTKCSLEPAVHGIAIASPL